jgi:hypothetical protein
MGHSPFAKRASSLRTGADRRRSTRVEHRTPIILSGHDASGRAFREETETHTVNLHGARIRTVHQLLMGMQVGVENPRNGLAEKAVCVRIENPAPGEGAGYIAVQFLRPANLWALENPPPDWAEVEAAEMGAPEASRRPCESSPAAPADARGASFSPPSISFDSRFAELERRSAQVMELTLQLLREQSEEIVRGVLARFEARLGEIEAASETHLAQGVDKILAEVESSFDLLRRDVAEHMAARRAALVDAAEEALKSKVAELVFPLAEDSARADSPPKVQPAAKK